MTLDTRKRDELRARRRKLDDLCRLGDDPAFNLFVRATENFLTAAGYKDQVLMRSAFEEAKTASGKLVTESVERLVGRSSAADEVIREFTDEFEGAVIEPDEQFDDLGYSISSLVSTVLGELHELRGGPVAMAVKHGISVPNAGKLDELIAHWVAVKANLVDCWPWTDSPLPPVDREMVARSRAAFQAGEKGEDIDALIERLRSE